MTQLFAQPYDLSATGFYFETTEEYETKAAALRNAEGHPVEEFEIKFIDGEGIDAELFAALSIHQGNTTAFFEAVAKWNDLDKIRVITAVEGGYPFDLAIEGPDDLHVDIYEFDSLRDLAAYFVDMGIYTKLANNIIGYIVDCWVSDELGCDYTETTINGRHYIYRLD